MVLQPLPHACCHAHPYCKMAVVQPCSLWGQCWLSPAAPWAVPELCHAMPCHAVPCRAVPCRAVPCCTVGAAAPCSSESSCRESKNSSRVREAALTPHLPAPGGMGASVPLQGQHSHRDGHCGDGEPWGCGEVWWVGCYGGMGCFRARVWEGCSVAGMGMHRAGARWGHSIVGTGNRGRRSVWGWSIAGAVHVGGAREDAGTRSER